VDPKGLGRKGLEAKKERQKTCTHQGVECLQARG